MDFIREKVFFGATMDQDTQEIGMAILESGVWLLIHEDGTATGSDGRMYARVSEEVPSEPMPKDTCLQYLCTSVEDFDKEPEETLPIPDTDLVTLGWTTDTDKPVIIGGFTETNT